MERYLQQLIDDLMLVVNHPPKLTFLDFNDQPVSAGDLQNPLPAPPRPISEWTGIAREAFPEANLLTADQCRQMNEVILKVFDALNLIPDDIPQAMPAEKLYMVLTSHWDYPVHCLSASGIKITFCTGDPETCPYESHCFTCTAVKKNLLAARYMEVIPLIAEFTEEGYACFLNPGTLEVEAVPGRMLDNPEEFYMSESSFASQRHFLHLMWKDCLLFEPLQETYLKSIVREFSQHIAYQSLGKKLLARVEEGMPYYRLDAKLKSTVYAGEWYNFKMQRFEQVVVDQLYKSMSIQNGLSWQEPDSQMESGTKKTGPAPAPLPSV